MTEASHSKRDLAAELDGLRQRLADRQASEARAAWTKAEAALDAGGGRFRVLFQSAPLGMVELDADGIVRAGNLAFLALVGRGASDIEQRPFTELVHAEDAARFEAHLQASLRDPMGAPRRLELRCVRADGSHGWTRVSIGVVPSGVEGSAVVATLVDVSASHAAEGSLRSENERLASRVAELEHRSLEHGLVSETGDLLQACRTVDEAYGVIARMGKRLFPTESGSVSVIGGATGLVEVVSTWGESRGDRLFGSDACWALRRGRPHLGQGDDPGPTCRHMPTPPEVAYVCVPMMAYGEAVGLLTLSVEAGRELTAAHQRLATTVAEHIALSLANLRLQETLRSQSIRDPLTGLFNRRYMEESLDRELRRAGRSRRPIGIIMLDLDHFKDYNDTHGHEIGDALLREVGAVLQRSIRGEDIACRYGGEEFILILPEASLPDAAQRAEQLRTAIAAIDVVHGQHAVGPLTVSLGVAIYPSHGSTGEAVVRAADMALYQAKTRGRNRVEVTRADASPVGHGPRARSTDPPADPAAGDPGIGVGDDQPRPDHQ